MACNGGAKLPVDVCCYTTSKVWSDFPSLVEEGWWGSFLMVILKFLHAGNECIYTLDGLSIVAASTEATH